MSMSTRTRDAFGSSSGPTGEAILDRRRRFLGARWGLLMVDEVRGDHGTKDSGRAMEGLAPVSDGGAHQAAGDVLEVCLGPRLHSQQTQPRGATRAHHPAAPSTRAVLCDTAAGGAPGVVLLPLGDARYPYLTVAV
jgi:hypothetical protein